MMQRIIVAVVLVATVVYVVRGIVRAVQNKNTCGCSCSHCAAKKQSKGGCGKCTCNHTLPDIHVK
ncbi:MAG: FeoB-associated Cys-rich membrane protein [Bacteroidales bacterium]|nr:FeoB-associated Cys-rich membrane protein [Bacteroidales bacterium]